MIDFQKLKETLPKHVAEPSPEYYEEWMDCALVLDFETSTILKGSAQVEENDVVLACWWYKGKEYYCFGSCFEQAGLLRHVEECSYVVAHNAKFELQWLKRVGLDLSTKLVYDTMLAEYVLGGNQCPLNKQGLDYVASKRLNARKIALIGMLYKAKLCSNDIPRGWLLKYCRRDVDLTRRLWYNTMEELKKNNLLPVMYSRCLVTPVLADIEFNGMCLDPERVVDMTANKEEEYREALRDFEQVSEGANPNSPKQMGELLYDKMGFAELLSRGKPRRTPAGGRLTDKDSISALKATNAKQRNFLAKFLKQKALYNELTKYLRKFSDCCKEAGGILRAIFNQTSTRTHRLSSSGLDYSTQFQNFPRAYKPMFKAREEGWLVGEGDGAQLEFRVAAHLGRDERALEDISDKVDIHSFTASVIGCSRQDAKADTFKPLYGGQSGTEKQQAYYAAFKQKYAGITATQQRWIDEVLTTGRLVTEWGLVYYWPGTKMSRSGYVDNTTSICNYPVQALATAEIIPIALVYAWHYMRALNLSMFIVNTIHDSIICELPPEEQEEFTEIMRRCLIHEAGEYLLNMYEVEFVAPLGAGVKVGPHWSEGEEVVYED